LRRALCAAALLLTAQTPVPQPPLSPTAPTLSVAQILAAHAAARAKLGVRVPSTMHVTGTVDGLGLHGTFESWRNGSDEREDETLGIRTERTLRLGDVEYSQNANGDVRVLSGLLARRQRTDDFIDSGAFTQHPENAMLLGHGTLHDGREIWELQITAPGGEPYAVAFDAKTWLVDRKAYVDGDAISSIVYNDYRVVHHALVPLLEIDSSGDHAFDIVSHVSNVAVDAPIAPAIFAPFVSATIALDAPVTLKLVSEGTHLFVIANAGDQKLTLLIDSGAQEIFIDAGAAKRLGLHGEGTLEIRGAQRTSGLGVAALDHLDFGSARLPVGVVSLVDLHNVTYHGATVDGILGFPFFAAAEVRIDPQQLTMTLGRPSTLPLDGAAIPVDTDRELPDIFAKIDGVAARFLIDTGNSNELLVFHAFADAHPGLAMTAGTRFSPNRGVGGSSAAVAGFVNQLDIGPYRLYNRYADIMLADAGAFADRNDAGNIGMGVLGQFVMTFDLAAHTLYLQKGSMFDDGRYRQPPALTHP
jgi:predicted aspartyl protease